MSMAENKYYEYFLRGSQTPVWMKGERIEYCEPYAKPAKRKKVNFLKK